jgi:DNA-binding transcriptional ArsR family regulator
LIRIPRHRTTAMPHRNFTTSHYLSIDLIKRLLYNILMDVFGALAEPTRREILEMLAAQGQMAASDIYAAFDSTPQAISQHLKVLRETGLVRVEKQAQKRLYAVNTEKVRELEEWARKTRQTWNARYDRLQKLLEEQGSDD